MDELREEIKGELEPGEQVLWATRPSIRHYVQRKLPLQLVMVGAAVALGLSSGANMAAAIGQSGYDVRLVLGAAAAVTVLAWLAALRLRLRTVYAITDRPLIRTGGQSRLTNRPGQTFSYPPQAVRFVEISNFVLWRHVYIDRVRWGDNRRTVLVGFEDAPDPPALRDRIQDWLDAWQQRLLADMAAVRIVSNEVHGFRLELPLSWSVEVGDAGTDQDAGSPAEWKPELQPWDGRNSGWSRLRASGPAGIVLAVEAIHGALRRSGDALNPAVERTLNRTLDLSRETVETELAGRPATLTTWSAHDLTMRVLEVPCGEVAFRIHLIAPAALPRFMDALRTVASSFQLTPSTASVAAGSRGAAGSPPAAPASEHRP